MTRKTILAAALLALPLAATAQEWRAVAMAGAWHAERTYWCGGTEREYETLTPGLGLAYGRGDWMLSGGVWRTSHDRWTPYAIGDWRPLRYGAFSAGLFAGASGGYCTDDGWRTLPLGGASLRVDHGTAAVHLLVIPHVTKNGSSIPTTIGVALSWRLG